MASATNTATTRALPGQPITIPSQTQWRSNHCATCSPLGKQCPVTYPMSLNPNWSDSEGEEKDWDGDRQKEKEQKELKLKYKNNGDYFPPSPKYTLNTPSNTDDTFTPELTNTLVPTSEETERRTKRERRHKRLFKGQF